MRSDAVETKPRLSSRERIILIGNPNVGKSVIFNYLTGKHVTVSNYPGTTVEVTQGTLSGSENDEQVIDTPGVNSLIPMSEDEKVTRDILLLEPPTHLIQVIDTKNIRRGLLISLQLSEMGFPFLVVLNMWDEAKSRGIRIQTEALAKTLGTPVLRTVATRRKGLEQIRENLGVPAPSSTVVSYPEAVEAGVSRILPLLPEVSISGRSLALMLLAGDESLTDWLHRTLSDETVLQVETIRQEIANHLDEPIGYLISQARLRKVDQILSAVMSTPRESYRSLSVSIGNLSIHPFWGIPILLSVLFVTYEFVGVFGAKISVDFLETIIFGKWILPPLTHLIQRFLPVPLLQDFFIGPYGLFTMALTYAIAIVLPIVGYFFLIFGIMEDSGYLPRLAVMTNQLFKKMGLNGKAVLPMVLGLGCDTMATMTTRILETEKDRTIVTLLLALGVPCSAQLGVILGMFAGLPSLYLLVWIGVIAGIIVVVGYLASRILPGEGIRFHPGNTAPPGSPALQCSDQNPGPDRMVSQRGGSSLHAWNPDPLSSSSNKRTDPPRTGTLPDHHAFPRASCQRDRGLYHRFSPKGLRGGRALRSGEGWEAQFAPDPRGSGDDDSLHSLHSPIFHDDQGEGIPEDPMDYGRGLPRRGRGRGRSPSYSDLVRGVAWPIQINIAAPSAGSDSLPAR